MIVIVEREYFSFYQLIEKKYIPYSKQIRILQSYFKNNFFDSKVTLSLRFYLDFSSIICTHVP